MLDYTTNTLTIQGNKKDIDGFFQQAISKGGKFPLLLQYRVEVICACGASGAAWDSEEIAVQRWNDRAPERRTHSNYCGISCDIIPSSRLSLGKLLRNRSVNSARCAAVNLKLRATASTRPFPQQPSPMFVQATRPSILLVETSLKSRNSTPEIVKVAPRQQQVRLFTQFGSHRTPNHWESGFGQLTISAIAFAVLKKPVSSV